MIGLVGLAMLAVLLGATEIGFRVGKRRENPEEWVISQTHTWEGALLGLLGLLLGFTFSMAVTRFDDRRSLVTSEAAALETTMLQAQSLSAPDRDRIDEILRRYASARVAYYDAGANREEVERTQAASIALQRELWSIVTAQARANPGSETVSLFADTASELVAMSVRRRAALDNHVPFAVSIVVLAVAAVCMGGTGFGCGLHRRRHQFGMVLIPVLLAVVITMIFDIDHPRIGSIRAGQGPMLRLTAGEGAPG
jgi:hypothetical protein